LIPSENRIQLLKIDIEGYKFFALQGASRILGRTDVVIFESWEKSQKQYHYKTCDLISYLRDFGFLIYRIEDDSFYSQIKN